MKEVVITQGEDRRSMICEAVEGLGDAFVEKVKSVNTIFIKPNLVHHERQLASTHVDAVRGLIDAIRPHSRAHIIIGDASYYGTKAAFRHFGYDRLPEEYDNVTLVDLNEDEYVDGHYCRKDKSLGIMRRSKIAHKADLKISLAVMKTHKDTGMTGAVKNWTIGTWVAPSRNSVHGRVWARWPWLHEEGPWAHHATIAKLYEELPCDIAIVDGILAMEGEGPTQGNAIPMNVVLAGFDAFAVDAVAATMMGIDPGDIGYLAMGAEQGLGSIDMTRINVPPMLLMESAKTFTLPVYTQNHLLDWKLEQ